MLILLLASLARAAECTIPDLAVSAFPPRPSDAASGTAFAARVCGLSDRERNAATRDELLAGNIPAFLRDLVPVTLAGPAEGSVITLFVTRDYLSIGGDDDFLPVPLDFGAASEVARALGYGLPTRKIVDAVYAAAALRLDPAPLPAGPEMRSVPYILESRDRIAEERGASPLSALVAGTKKDVVLSPRLLGQPDREAIYGWHRSDGRPIQPLSTVHGVHYADYSHGIRLVSDVVYVDGVARNYFDLLADPLLAACLSDEGPIPEARAMMETAAAAGG